MAKVKYRFNPKTLNYEEVTPSFKDYLLKLAGYVAVGLFFAITIVFSAYTFIDSPKELALKRENQKLKQQYTLLNKQLDRIDNVLGDIQHRDDNIYRTIFEAEPIPSSVRQAGMGGVNRYESLEGFKSSDLLIETTSRLDKLAKQLYVQSKSFDEVINMAKNKEKMLASIPAIQPVANKDLKRMASGYGYRIDPVYKTKKFHAGMDFSAPTGTEIYATGDGTVVKVKEDNRGYGHHVVIDHGFSYETLYAHLSDIKIKEGDEVKRGEIIGLVGNTGKSVGPHLHYEVRKNGRAVNPINFYFNDLTPEEYDLMLEISANINQSFD